MEALPRQARAGRLAAKEGAAEPWLRASSRTFVWRSTSAAPSVVTRRAICSMASWSNDSTYARRAPFLRGTMPGPAASASRPPPAACALPP
jgi:hypothetical protein